MRKIVYAIMALSALAANAEGSENIKVDGQMRNMIVHVPTALPENSPLVISLHGFNQSAEYQQSTTRWDQVADTAKFVVVYPNAINTWWDVYGDTDLHFVEAIIDNMIERYDINPQRVYVTGFSLGSMMTYHCIEHLSHKIAAFGPVSGVRFDNKMPAASRPVPIIHTHGTTDDVFKWGGDPGHQAGGYPAITEYVKRWVAFDGLNPEPTVIDPYKNTTYTIWRDDNTTTEIVLMAVKGCGHWHSEGSDWGDVSTSKEIWNFVKRYTLGEEIPVPPVAQGIDPEDHSFDLPLTHDKFTISLNKPADISRAKAQLVGNGRTIDLTATEAENGVTFVVGKDANLSEGEYKLNIYDLYDPKGGRERSYSYTYTYGVEEVGLKMNVDTLYSNKWDEMRNTVGEGIPYGWKRVNSRSNGENDTKNSGDDNTGGARLKYFEDGGEFNTGFYLSARDYDKCELTYGTTTGYLLKIPAGHFDFSFRSTYWSEGSENAGAHFNAYIASRASGSESLIDGEGLTSSGCMKESTSQKIIGSKLHEYDFILDKGIMAQIVFTMTEGWNSIILGDILLTSHATDADRYKGGLYRMLHEAKNIITETAGNTAIQAVRAELQNCIDKYDNLSSTAPSVYLAAMAELEQCMLNVRKSNSAAIVTLTNNAEPVEAITYSLDGRRVDNSYHGIAVRRIVYSNGAVVSEKIVN